MQLLQKIALYICSNFHKNGIKNTYSKLSGRKQLNHRYVSPWIKWMERSLNCMFNVSNAFLCVQFFIMEWKTFRLFFSLARHFELNWLRAIRTMNLVQIILNDNTNFHLRKFSLFYCVSLRIEQISIEICKQFIRVIWFKKTKCMEKIYFVNSFQYLSYRIHAMFKQIDSCKAHVTHVTNEMKSQAMSIMPTIVYHKICCIFGLSIFRLVFRFNADFLG